MSRFGKKPIPFDQRYAINKTTGCWEWDVQGTGGYGQIRIDGFYDKAHRVSWKRTYGEIPQGMFVCHKCDVPRCVNPEHLFLGTPKDNMTDMIAKKRSFRQKQTHCHKGHLLLGDNVGLYSRGKNKGKYRKCKTCAREWKELQKLLS